MQISVKPREAVWRRPGRPAVEIPEQAHQLANSTYLTGNVVEVIYSPSDPEKAAEADDLKKMMRAAAAAQGKRMRVQETELRNGQTRLAFEMVDAATSGRKTA